MGLIPILLVGIFILLGFVWYWFYARDKVWREYSLLHLVERVTGEKNTGYLLDEELREILIERDDVTEKRKAEAEQKTLQLKERKNARNISVQQGGMIVGFMSESIYHGIMPGKKVKRRTFRMVFYKCIPFLFVCLEAVMICIESDQCAQLYDESNWDYHRRFYLIPG